MPTSQADDVMRTCRGPQPAPGLWRDLNGPVVAGHFQIAHAPEWLRIALTSENNGAFPIVRGKFCLAGQLLGFQRRFRFEFDAQFWNGDSPMDWIAGARMRARPNFAGRLQREVRRAQMRRLSICIHKRAGRVRINRTILAANVKEHHLRMVLKLQAQPVPAGLAGFELMRKEFMVHPTYAAYFKFVVTEIDDTGSRQAR